ncbi:TolC family protein [Paraflavitalea pollutisoli]|uniref:TolC family protein n=1 Tax=Paraflavitalea pollutisoli TaxID=3034143 RepID=UPI0023EB3296|nr:TolC family protein [Paraflavitalea sp. H1-2-19X]
MKRVLVFFIAIVLTGVAQAQDSLTLQEAIEAALKNNYDILLSRNDAESYAIDYSYSWAAFLPQVNGTAGTTWNKNNQQLKFQKRVGGGDSSVTRDAVKTHNMNYALNLNWTLFDGLKMFATRERLEELDKLGELGVKTQVVNTVASVVNSYYIIVRQKQQLRAIEEQISINEERVKLADKKISVGLGSKPELLQARVDLNAQKAAQLTQLTLIAQLRDRLNQMIGFRTGVVYNVSDSIPLNMSLQFGEFAQKFEESNPSLLFAKKNIDISRISLRERKADLFPTLSFNSSYNFTQNDNSVAVNINQPFFNRNKGFNYGFGLNVPILNGFNTKRLIRQAEIDIRYNQLLYANQRSQIDMGISNAFKDYELQKQLLALEDDNIQLAKENVMIALARFKQGVSTYLELREAQISLQDAYNRLIAARYNTKLAETELLRLKGDLVR